MLPGEPAFTTTLTNGTSIAQGVFIEMFLTAELVFTVLMLAAEKSKATFIAPGKRSSRRSLTSMVLDGFMFQKIKEEAEKARIFPLRKKLLTLSTPIVGIGLALFVAELAGM